MNLIGLRVLAFLPSPLQARLRLALKSDGSDDPRHQIDVAEDWPQVLAAIASEESDVAILDPNADGTSRTSDIAELLKSNPTTPILLYTVVMPSTFKAIAELTRYGAQHIILYRYDDEPSHLRELIEHQSGHALTTAVLQQMTPGVESLPPSLSRAVHQLFRRPDAFRNAADLSLASGIPRRTIYREFARSGLASPRTVVAAARALRAYAYSRDHEQSLDEIATKLHYSTSRVLTRHMRDLLGASPRTKEPPADVELVKRLADRLYDPMGIPPSAELPLDDASMSD